MTENMAARGEGLAGAIACVKEFIVWATEQIGTSEAHGCAEQAEDALKLLEAAAPAGTAPDEHPFFRYAHMCRDGHAQIGHNDSSSEMCPLCRALATPTSQVGEGAPERLMTATGPVSLADFSRNLADDIYAISDGAAPDRETLRAMIRARLEVGLKYWKWERAVLGRSSSVPVGEQK